MTVGNAAQLFGQSPSMISISSNAQQTSKKKSAGDVASEKFQDFMKKNTDNVLEIAGNSKRMEEVVTSQKYPDSQNLSKEQGVETGKTAMQQQTEDVSEKSIDISTDAKTQNITAEEDKVVEEPIKEDKRIIEVAGKMVELTLKETTNLDDCFMKAQVTESGLELTISFPKLSEEVKTALTQLKEQLVQKIKDGFQVSEEEVQQAMETLAITMFDLMQNGGLQQMAVALGGGDSLVALVTSEDLMGAYQKVSQELNEFMESLPVDVTQTMEEIAGKLSQMTAKFDELLKKAGVDTPEQLEAAVKEVKTEIGKLMTQAILDTPKNVDADVPAETIMLEETVSLDGMSEAGNPVAENGILKENPEEILSTEKNVWDGANASVQTELEDAFKADVKVAGKENEDGEKGKIQDLKEPSKGEVLKETLTKMAETDQKGFAAKDQNSSQGNSSFGDLEKTITKGQEQKNVTTVQTVSFDNQIQTITKTEQTSFEGIVRQIVQQVKVQVKPDTVSMELQLNPENLGKVNLHVSSKEGAVTAQLFVQNETVKQAIEGQIMVLREAMQQQGIKVEAVEVTVETGDSSRNLEQHEEDSKENAREQARKVSRKNINLLNGLEEVDLEEEEILRTHIMRQSGNSLDMNA